MKFNYAKEKRKFDQHWAIIRQQYENLGMHQDAIDELYPFDWNWFKSRRRYINRLVDIPEGATIEDFPRADSRWIVGDLPPCSRFGADCIEHHWWLEEIENAALLQKLMLLSPDDIELLTQLVFEEHTQKEIAQIRGCSQAAIFKRLDKIKKILK